MPGFCKEVLVLHHSHFDVGFTHPQPIVWELHRDFLDEAMAMLRATEDWPEAYQPKWTCEVTAPLCRWMAGSLQPASSSNVAGFSDAGRFGEYLRQGRIGISALEYNTTPLCSAEELARQLYDAKTLRKLGASIDTANTHDVTGLPWTIVDLLLDSDVKLLIMGINLHLGGTPLPRPAVYRWRGPSGRELLVLNGEHYSMFDQWLETGKNDLEAMRAGLDKYLRHLEKLHYPYDFVYLTATCAPYAYDNSPPNADLPNLVRQWNQRGCQPPIRFVTPHDLLERIERIPAERLPVVSGDWTDYWNFGAASSAAETRMTRNAKADLAAADLLQAFGRPDARLQALAKQVWADVKLYDEHTWGAAGSLDHDSPMTALQWQLKAQPACEAQPLAQYVLARQLDALAGNPPSAPGQEGVLVVNPGSSPLKGCVPVPEAWRRPGKRIASNWMRQQIVSGIAARDTLCGPIEVPPFGWKMIPLVDLKPATDSGQILTGEDFLESPTHRLTFDPATGRVTRLLDKDRLWQVLAPESPWSFFELVHEKPDPAVEPSRKAFHVRNPTSERVGLTGWKPEWKAVRSGTRNATCRVERTAMAATLIVSAEAEGVKALEQRITLRADSSLIELSAKFIKEDVRSPEAVYFAFPLNLPSGWRCHFDTAAVPTELDAEQIPGACRDWVTVDSYACVHHGQRGATLLCPDAPLVQVGGFNFGRNQASIARHAEPLLLAWALNNYWETNFRASQPGCVELRYGFLSHGSYDPARAVRQAARAIHPLRIHPVMRCPAPREGRFLHVAGRDVVVVYVKPAEDGQGIVVRLINLGGEVSQAELTLPGRPITSAWRSSALEENRERLSVRDNAVRFSLNPRQLTTLRVR